MFVDLSRVEDLCFDLLFKNTKAPNRETPIRERISPDWRPTGTGGESVTVLLVGTTSIMLGPSL